MKTWSIILNHVLLMNEYADVLIMIKVKTNYKQIQFVCFILDIQLIFTGKVYVLEKYIWEKVYLTVFKITILMREYIFFINLYTNNCHAFEVVLTKDTFTLMTVMIWNLYALSHYIESDFFYKNVMILKAFSINHLKNIRILNENLSLKLLQVKNGFRAFFHPLVWFCEDVFNHRFSKSFWFISKRSYNFERKQLITLFKN